MFNFRPYLVVAALAVASPASAETDAELATDFADAMSSQSSDVVFHRLIEFAPASARVYSADRELLARMAKTWLQSGQETMITVHGYSESLDLRLAERRAKIIRGYLIKAGISPSRVAAIGHTLDKDGRRIDLTIGSCGRGPCTPTHASR
jgi:outer membrane protein OmpA-like peptidoglycan-associated protein